MGVGTPIDLLEGIARGVDMFDCVMPTRNGRNAMAFTWTGSVKMRNAKYAEDPEPLDPNCPCLACRHSKAYLRHLFIANEMLGPTLLTHHNLTFYQQLMAEARKQIRLGSFSTWLETMRPILTGRAAQTAASTDGTAGLSTDESSAVDNDDN
jgi:queuine tRNA-ribosyltransferase